MAVILKGVSGSVSITPPTWTIPPEIVPFGGGTIDLTKTLPTGIALGGPFAVDSTSTPAPAGYSLSSAGIITVAAGTLAPWNGMVIAYAVPGT